MKSPPGRSRSPRRTRGARRRAAPRPASTRPWGSTRRPDPSSPRTARPDAPGTPRGAPPPTIQQEPRALPGLWPSPPLARAAVGTTGARPLLRNRPRRRACATTRRLGKDPWLRQSPGDAGRSVRLRPAAERIAQHPVRPRDAARLLVVGEHAFEDRLIGDLPGRSRPGDLLVFNDTRVIPARLIGRRGDATVEVTFHQPVGDPEAADMPRRPCRRRPARGRCPLAGVRAAGERLRVGDRLTFGPAFGAEVWPRVRGAR